MRHGRTGGSSDPAWGSLDMAVFQYIGGTPTPKMDGL